MGVAGRPVKRAMPRHDVIRGYRVESVTAWFQPGAAFSRDLAESPSAANWRKTMGKTRTAGGSGRQAGKSRGAMVYYR